MSLEIVFIESVSKKTLEKIKKKILENMVMKDNIATRLMYESVSVHDGKIIIDVPYAWYVNVGTKPHIPPLRPLIKWAKAKFQLDDDTAKRVAYSVRRLIAERGTKAYKFIDDSLFDSGFEISRKEFLGRDTIIYVIPTKSSEEEILELIGSVSPSEYDYILSLMQF